MEAREPARDMVCDCVLASVGRALAETSRERNISVAICFILQFFLSDISVNRSKLLAGESRAAVKLAPALQVIWSAPYQSLFDNSYRYRFKTGSGP